MHYAKSSDGYLTLRNLTLVGTSMGGYLPVGTSLLHDPWVLLIYLSTLTDSLVDCHCGEWYALPGLCWALMLEIIRIYGKALTGMCLWFPSNTIIASSCILSSRVISVVARKSKSRQYSNNGGRNACIFVNKIRCGLPVLLLHQICHY